MQPIIALYQFPSMGDVECNLSAILSGGLLDTLKALSQDQILHLILMIDEIALEKRIWWDSRTTKFLGVCREHADKVSTTFETMADAEELVKAIDDGRVHLASKVSSDHSHVTMHSHSIFSSNRLLLPCLAFSQIINAFMLHAQFFCLVPARRRMASSMLSSSCFLYVPLMQHLQTLQDHRLQELCLLHLMARHSMDTL
jgi:hypothetical protein